MIFCDSLFHETHFILHKWKIKTTKRKEEERKKKKKKKKKKNPKNLSSETLFLHQWRLFHYPLHLSMYVLVQRVWVG